MIKGDSGTRLSTPAKHFEMFTEPNRELILHMIKRAGMHAILPHKNGQPCVQGIAIEVKFIILIKSCISISNS